MEPLTTTDILLLLFAINVSSRDCKNYGADLVVENLTSINVSLVSLLKTNRQAIIPHDQIILFLSDLMDG